MQAGKIMGVTFGALVVSCSLLAAEELQPVPLPKPQMEGGRPLMQVLKDRKSSREFNAKKLPDQVLSNLLWAAYGVNRPDGKRTAPSAVNWQEIDIYVANADGLFVYDAKANALRPVLPGQDVRQFTGAQPFVKDAPVNLVYVADYAKMGRGSDANKDRYSAADAGFIAQNVYLFCASEGLAVVVRGSIDGPAFARQAKLRPEQKVVLAQTVGYPK